MALLRIAILSLLLAAAARAVEIRFVPAIPEGTVSLGIYDQSGKLVRLLCDEWPVDRFTAGLNGLSTEWDGKDADGQPVPAGVYRARGFVMGDVRIEGEAIHFNDWIDSDNAPRIVSVGSIALLEGGDLLLAARLVGDTGALLRYSPRSAAPWQTLATEEIPDAVGRVKIASASGRIFLLVEGQLRVLDAASGKEVLAPPLDGQLSDMAAYGNRLALLTG
ncbi:MAG: FlgD immunoglobulin-like domain containing protein, partial [Chthoniobacterales bacterium]